MPIVVSTISGSIFTQRIPYSTVWACRCVAVRHRQAVVKDAMWNLPASRIRAISCSSRPTSNRRGIPGAAMSSADCCSSAPAGNPPRHLPCHAILLVRVGLKFISGQISGPACSLRPAPSVYPRCILDLEPSRLRCCSRICRSRRDRTRRANLRTAASISDSARIRRLPSRIPSTGGTQRR